MLISDGFSFFFKQKYYFPQAFFLFLFYGVTVSLYGAQRGMAERLHRVITVELVAVDPLAGLQRCNSKVKNILVS